MRRSVKSLIPLPEGKPASHENAHCEKDEKPSCPARLQQPLRVNTFPRLMCNCAPIEARAGKYRSNEPQHGMTSGRLDVPSTFSWQIGLSF